MHEHVATVDRKGLITYDESESFGGSFYDGSCIDFVILLIITVKSIALTIIANDRAFSRKN